MSIIWSRSRKKEQLFTSELCHSLWLWQIYTGQLQQKQQSRNWGLFHCFLLWALVNTSVREILLEQTAWKNKIQLCMERRIRAAARGASSSDSNFCCHSDVTMSVKWRCLWYQWTSVWMWESKWSKRMKSLTNMPGIEHAVHSSGVTMKLCNGFQQTAQPFKAKSLPERVTFQL